MAKPTRGRVSDREVPNEHVFYAARGFHEAARQLAQNLNFNSSLVPLYMLGSFALELYLKALNSSWVYPELPGDPATSSLLPATNISSIDQYRQTARPDQLGHNLVALFRGLDQQIQDELSREYAARLIVKANSLAEALEPFKNTFVQARYVFEDGNLLPKDGPDDLLALVNFLGGYVETKHKNHPRTVMRKKLQAKFDGNKSMEPSASSESVEATALYPIFVGANVEDVADLEGSAEKVLHLGTMSKGSVLLDLGETLHEESIVEVEVVDGSILGEIGVVEAGKIKFNWPDAIPEGTRVTVEVTGKLLSLDELHPAFKIGDRAVSSEVSRIDRTLDDSLYGHPKGEDR